MVYMCAKGARSKRRKVLHELHIIYNIWLSLILYYYYFSFFLYDSVVRFCTYKVLVVERSDRLHVHLQQRQDRFQLISRKRLYELRLYNWIFVGR